MCITRVTFPKTIYTVHDIPASQLQMQLVHIKGNVFIIIIIIIIIIICFSISFLQPVFYRLQPVIALPE